LKTSDCSRQPEASPAGDASLGGVLFVGAASLLALVIFVLAVSALTLQMVNAKDTSIAAQSVPELDAVLAAQRTKLSGKAATAGRPGMSIERAMQLVVDELAVQALQEPRHDK
jgi:hypothetical protein